MFEEFSLNNSGKIVWQIWNTFHEEGVDASVTTLSTWRSRKGLVDRWDHNSLQSDSEYGVWRPREAAQETACDL